MWCGVVSYAVITRGGCSGFGLCNHPLEYLDETRLFVVCYNQQYVRAINACDHAGITNIHWSDTTTDNVCITGV